MTHLHLHRLRTAQTGVKYEPSCYGTNKIRLVAVVPKSAPPRGQSEQASAERPRSWTFKRVPQINRTRNDQKRDRSAEAWVSARLSDHDPMIEFLARDCGFLSMKTCSLTDKNDNFDQFSNKLFLFQKTKMGTEWIFISYFHFVWSIHCASVSFPSNELSE